MSAEKHRHVEALAVHRVFIGMLGHLGDDFFRDVGAEQVRHELPVTGFREEAPHDVEEVEAGQHDQRAGEREHQIARLPGPRIHAQKQGKHDGRSERRRQRGQPRQEHHQRNADEQDGEHGNGERLRRPGFHGVVERAGNEAGVDLRAWEVFPCRCGADVDESPGRGADDDDPVLQLVGAERATDHVGSRDVPVAALAAVRDERRHPLVERNAHSVADVHEAHPPRACVRPSRRSSSRA